MNRRDLEQLWEFLEPKLTLLSPSMKEGIQESMFDSLTELLTSKLVVKEETAKLVTQAELGSYIRHVTNCECTIDLELHEGDVYLRIIVDGQVDSPVYKRQKYATIMNNLKNHIQYIDDIDDLDALLNGLADINLFPRANYYVDVGE